MANSSPFFWGVQAGIESVRGTEVDATVKLGGLTDVRPGWPYQVEQTPELDGSMSVARDSADVLFREGMLVLTNYASFQDLPYYLGMGYAASATGTGDGGTPPMYSRTYAAGLSALNDPATLTLEAFSNTEEWVGTYGMLQSFVLRAARRGFTILEANVHLKDLLKGAKTAALSNRTQTRLKASGWAMKLDYVGGSSIGTTDLADCWDDFSLDSGPLFEPVDCMDSTLKQSSHMQQQVQPRLTFTVRAGTDSYGALYDAYVAGTLVRIRLTNTGPVIHDAVTNKVIVDITGNLLVYPSPTGNTQGSQTRQFVLTGAEDSATSRVIHWTVQNAIASLASGA